MKIIEISPLNYPVFSSIKIPGSKSQTNRALILAAITKGPVMIFNPLFSDDTYAMISCLKKVGLQIEIKTESVIIYDDISMVQNTHYDLFVADSGTTMRFLLALFCLTPGAQTLVGSKRLNERPIKDLVDSLRLLGAEIDYLEKENFAPLKIHSSILNDGSKINLDASISSQFLSALLMIAPLLKGLVIQLTEPIVSKSYVDMTIQMMTEWGINVLVSSNGNYTIAADQDYQKKQVTIEADYSSAGYFFAIAALTQSTIRFDNLNPSSIQPDNHFLFLLEKMGNQIIRKSKALTFVGKQIIPLSIDMEKCPDQVQTMAVLAAFSSGTTKISGVRSLRYKETERVKALRQELSKMGIQTEETYDTLTIYGGNPHAATIETYGDHRMAMAFAVAGTKLQGMKIKNPDVINKTFPSFWETLGTL